MDNQVHNAIVNFIWGIADDCLRDIYVRGKYRDVILPMTVIRRLDAMLEDTKPAVLEMKKMLDDAGITNQWPALCNATGQAFCNASPFRLRDLTSRAKKQTLKADFEAYLDGFSPNVQEILAKFQFRNQIDTMIEADILGAVIEKFISPDINLSPNPVYRDDTKTQIKLPALDNHGMGTVFEELVRRFNEANNEEAGEHWTPRDVVDLMADLILVPVGDQIMDATYSCYDGACGTGGMLTVAQDRLLTLANRRGKEVSIHLFGQEVQPETYAICKADMLLKGDGDQADHIAYGSTLSADGHATRQFDFMLANPPYGKSWKVDAEKMGGKKDILPLYAIAKEKSICNCTDLQLLSVYLDEGVVPFSTRTERRTNATSADLSKYQRVDAGDFVLNNQQAWRGSVGVSRHTGIVSPAYVVLQMDDTLISEYANYLLRSRIMVDQYLINSKSVGSIQRNIYWPALKRVSVLVPSIDEQKAIVRFLDWKVSTFNKLINIYWHC